MTAERVDADVDADYAESLIEFVRTFETGDHAARALPIFLRTHQKAQAARDRMKEDDDAEEWIAEFEALAAQVRSYEGSITGHQIGADEWRGLRSRLRTLLAARVRAAKAEALREAADKWQMSDWSNVLQPKLIPPFVPVIAYSNRVRNWLRDRAASYADQPVRMEPCVEFGEHPVGKHDEAVRAQTDEEPCADVPRCQYVSPSPWGPTQCALPDGHDERHAYDPAEES